MLILKKREGKEETGAGPSWPAVLSLSACVSLLAAIWRGCGSGVTPGGVGWGRILHRAVCRAGAGRGKAAGAARLVLGMDGPGVLAALGDVCRVQAALEGCGGCGVSLCCSFCMRRGIVAGASPLCAALQPAEGRGWGLGTRMPKAALPGPPPSAPLLWGPSGACGPHPRRAGGCCNPHGSGGDGQQQPRAQTSLSWAGWARSCGEPPVPYRPARAA